MLNQNARLRGITNVFWPLMLSFKHLYVVLTAGHQVRPLGANPSSRTGMLSEIPNCPSVSSFVKMDRRAVFLPPGVIVRIQ